MTFYHAVLLDETGCEFGVSLEADCRDDAYDHLQDNYPESQVVQLEDPRQTDDRITAMYRRVAFEIDNDCDYDIDYEYED